HAGAGSARERVARARAALIALADGAGADAYGTLLRSEAKQLEKAPASYILGEFLAADNAPIQFLDFVSAADGHGLEFICESDLASGARASITRHGAERIDALARGDRLTAAQELDLQSGRPFRRSILRKKASKPLQPPSIAGLADLHIAASLSP